VIVIMFTIHPIPAFTDNYIWALRSIQQPESVAVVDPGDAAPVRAWLEANGCTLAAVLITHHHDDHTGGVQALVEHTRIPCRRERGWGCCSTHCRSRPYRPTPKITSATWSAPISHNCSAAIRCFWPVVAGCSKARRGRC
jgi:ribonuclease BN (tRNA processing enzyme)